MARLPIAICPKDIPPLPTLPHPSPSPLQQLIGQTVAKTDYDAICVPLTNARWQDRWERLCLRPVGAEDEDDGPDQDGVDGQGSLRDRTGDVDREADLFRREPSLLRDECNITRLEESQNVIALASDWLELDSPDEGIRFDSELVGLVVRRIGRAWRAAAVGRAGRGESMGRCAVDTGSRCSHGDAE